jgi:hypothetical protein
MKKITSSLIAASLLLCVAVKPAKAEVEANPITSLLGVILGTPVSTVSGLLRGSITKGSEYSGTFSEEMGGGTLGHLIGVPTGMVTGIVTGGSTGLIKGLINGIVVGVEEPFSAESMSLNGEFADYDPYNLDPK